MVQKDQLATCVSSFSWNIKSFVESCAHTFKRWIVVFQVKSWSGQRLPKLPPSCCCRFLEPFLGEAGSAAESWNWNQGKKKKKKNIWQLFHVAWKHIRLNLFMEIGGWTFAAVFKNSCHSNKTAIQSSRDVVCVHKWIQRVPEGPLLIHDNLSQLGIWKSTHRPGCFIMEPASAPLYAAGSLHWWAGNEMERCCMKVLNTFFWRTCKPSRVLAFGLGAEALGASLFCRGILAGPCTAGQGYLPGGGWCQGSCRKLVGDLLTWDYQLLYLFLTIFISFWNSSVFKGGPKLHHQRAWDCPVLPMFLMRAEPIMTPQNLSEIW